MMRMTDLQDRSLWIWEILFVFNDDPTYVWWILLELHLTLYLLLVQYTVYQDCNVFISTNITFLMLLVLQSMKSDYEM